MNSEENVLPFPARSAPAGVDPTSAERESYYAALTVLRAGDFTGIAHYLACLKRYRAAVASHVSSGPAYQALLERLSRDLEECLAAMIDAAPTPIGKAELRLMIRGIPGR